MYFDSLVKKYNLNDTEQSILRYLYHNIDDLKKIGIRKVAKDNFTSTTTIYKLCKKLNYDGYSDMVYNLSYQRESENENNQIVDVYTNASIEVKSNLEDFSDILTKSKNKLIMFLSTGISQTIANYLNERLAINGFRSISNTHIQLLTKDNKDDILLFVISNSGETKSIVEIVSKASEAGIDIISFVADKDSSVAKLSTLPIIIQGKDHFGFLNNTPNTFYSELLLIFECFISNIDL